MNDEEEGVVVVLVLVLVQVGEPISPTSAHLPLAPATPQRLQTPVRPITPLNPQTYPTSSPEPRLARASPVLMKLGPFEG